MTGILKCQRKALSFGSTVSGRAYAKRQPSRCNLAAPQQDTLID